MKLLDSLFKSVEPLFAKGGKLESLHPIFEATESFFLTSDKVTSGRVHVRDAMDSKRLMITVVNALIPCVLFGAYNVGYQRQIAVGAETGIITCLFIGLIAIIPIIFVSYAVGGACETLFSVVRKEEITEGFLVTGLLFPLTLPPTIPLWMVAVGVAFGVIIGKEVFGGTGMNILNPALTARAFVFFSYPAAISGDTCWTVVDKSKDAVMDGWSGATALGVAARESGNTGVALANAGYTWMDAFLGFIPGSIGETSTAIILLMGAYLIYTKVASWRSMAGCLLGMFTLSAVTGFFATPESAAILHMPFHWHLVLGGYAFGMVYMVTDPVSSASTKTGKWIYGFFIGVLVVIIRAVNPAYPEGMMLAILFMNVFAPLIDYVVVRNHSRRRALARA